MLEPQVSGTRKQETVEEVSEGEKNGKHERERYFVPSL